MNLYTVTVEKTGTSSADVIETSSKSGESATFVIGSMEKSLFISMLKLSFRSP